ncbi:MAG: phosphate signaling complex protein PhoU [Lachnospiraceae bacterium]|nr:phosphate signaling complex protein PhoU [Lachnospiraceae bacterium]
MVVRQRYMAELEEMNRNVIQMSTLLEESIGKVIYALKNKDSEVAKKIIKDDDAIDEMERKIEAECITIIAKEQPVAKDLRRVTSIMRMISDIERIADHCADISEYIIMLSKEDSIPMPKSVEQMLLKMKEMVVAVIDSFVNEDLEKACWVKKEDDVVDDYFDSILQELCVDMKNNPEAIKQYAYMIMIIKYIERMADHATNMAEWNAFIITGDL